MKLHHRLLPLWILLLGSLWATPVPAQDPRLEKYLAEVLTITSKYPNQAIPLHRAGGKEKRDAVRLYAIADALTRLAPKKYPRNLSPRERLSILVKEQSPTLSQSFASAEQNALKDIGTATENEDLKAEERRERLDHSDDWQPTREDEKKFLKKQEQLQKLRQKALGFIHQYEATGGPRQYANKGETEPSAEEVKASWALRRISARLHSIDPDQFEDSSDRKNLARLFSAVPGEGPSLEALFFMNRASPGFSAAVTEWQKAKNTAPTTVVHKSDSIEPLRQEALQILKSYPLLGRPRLDSPIQKEVSDAKRLEALGRGVIESDPYIFANLNPLQALARVVKEVDPLAAALLRLDVHSEEFKAVVRERNQVKAMMPEAEHKILEYQKEVIAIFDTYSDTGGPRAAPTLLNEADRAREIKAYVRLTEISNRLGGLDPTRFLPRAQRENLARLVKDLPGGGAELAEVIRTRQGLSEIRKRVSEWRSARAKAQASLPAAPDMAPTRAMPERLRAFLDQYTSVKSILNDSVKIMLEFRETGGPIERKNPQTPEQKRERSAARFLQLLNYRLREIDPKLFSLPGNVGNLAKAIENVPGQGTELADLLRTDRVAEPELYEQKRQKWLAVFERDRFIDCLSSGGQKSRTK